jgi:hypothetical protein
LKKSMAGLLVIAMLIVGSPAFGQTMSPCVGGCDAEYIPFGLNYDPYYMWETYGYPIFQDNRYWYLIDGEWWYFLPHTYGSDGSLHPYESG